MNNETFTNTFKNFIQNIISELSANTSLDNQLEWELVKYEIRRFSRSYCKQHTRKDETERSSLKIN